MSAAPQTTAGGQCRAAGRTDAARRPGLRAWARARRWLTCWALALTAGCGHRGATQAQAGEALQRELAEVLVAHHAYDPALPLLQKRVHDAPDDARAHLMLGMVLRDRGLYPQAREELEHAVHLEQNDPDAAAALGVLFDLMKDGPTALIWHRRAITLAPERADLYNNLGFSHSLAGDLPAAEEAYRAALLRDPGLHRVYNNLGFVQARRGDYEAALRSFQQGSNRPGALVNLGLSYEMAGDLVAARGLYEEALRLDRKATQARRNLDGLLARIPNDLPHDKEPSP